LFAKKPSVARKVSRETQASQYHKNSVREAKLLAKNKEDKRQETLRQEALQRVQALEEARAAAEYAEKQSQDEES
jgi:hypothetical protein